MRRHSPNPFVPSLLAALLTLSLIAQPVTRVIAAAPQTAPKVADTPLDTPDSVIASGVGTYALAAPKIFWSELTFSCDPDSSVKTVRDFIKRMAAQGSNTRTLYDQTFVGSLCGSRITSNIVADKNNLYWASDGALLRLPTTAFTLTVPTTVTTQVNGNVELMMTGGFVYALTKSNGLWKVTLPNGGATRIVTSANVGGSPKNLQTDGLYTYWLTGGVLKRYTLSDGAITQIGGSSVTGYYPSLYLCIIGPCPGASPSGVYVAYTNVIKRYNLISGVFIADIYTSPEATAYIRELLVGGPDLFWLEDRITGPANPFPPVNTFIHRKKGDGTGSASLLYTSGSSIVTGPDSHLIGYDDHIYWQDSDKLLRLPFDASALPLTNLRITALEVTQGIQDLSNGVPLIQGKRTAVRMHIKSDGPTVNGITARLYRLDATLQPIGEGLLPINSVGQYLNAQASPQRANLDDGFWFELPLDWLNSGILRLRGELNPFHYPPQTGYANNSKSVILFTLPSPRLEMNFVLFDYDFGGQNFAADYFRDYLPTLSWMHRGYPISDRQDYIENAGPGLHTHYFYMHDQQLPKHLNYASSDCPDDPKDDGGLCASHYVNSVLEDIDDEDNNSASYYGYMPSLPGNFARGSTSGDTSNGPADAACSVDAGGNRKCGWDIDTTIADWYAAHEIGHQLGRDHPKPAGDPDPGDSTKVGCGHSADDGSYPYSGARIGDGSLWGFDLGDLGVSKWLSPTVYPNDIWHDVMSYCSNQWISDYTYLGIYNNLKLVNEANVSTAQATTPSFSIAKADADVLKVNGVILSASNTVKFISIKHKAGTPSVVGSGNYRLRLLDAANAVLSTTIFTPTIADDTPGVLPFALVVPFVGGTRKLEVQNATTSQPLGSYLISANAPTISNVHLVGASTPVTGTVSLAWDASDADGDALSFNIFYSKDNGAHFQPVQMNVTGSSTSINTSLLPGSAQGMFKVVASDGANNASATSPAFAMANKPPKVTIISPANNVNIAYGQLVNLIGIIEDDQTNGVPSGQITWRNQYGVLGTGAQLPVTTLPPGANVITLTAQSSTGLSASASIVVNINDDLDLPGPTLTAAPGQIGWHFDEGATATQTATAYIGNAGSGTLAWSATIDAAQPAPWLSLSASSGNTPGSITLTANPTGVGDVDFVSTVLHITAGNQHMDIPVVMSFGDSFNGNKLPAADGKRKVFLPIVQR